MLYKLATMEDLPAMGEAGDLLFDYPIKRERAIEFLNDPRHCLILAYAEERAIGMASGFVYVHPDKDPTLFVNEVSVIEEYQNQGIGRTVVKQLIEHGKTLGCKEAWIATEESNLAARKAYLAAGGVEDQDLAVVIDFKI